MRGFLVCLLLAVSVLPVFPGTVHAGAADAYRQAMSLAAQGRDAEAAAMLAGGAEVAGEVWSERMRLAAGLIGMRQRLTVQPPELAGMNGALATAYLTAHAAPLPADARVAGLLATAFPGAGHAWLGRWTDARTAALMVWPMLLLTLWAWKRSMGPLTVLLALMTLWLWSGSVFSAVSLAERGAFEAYVLWWQGLWQASGLPGRPW